MGHRRVEWCMGPSACRLYVWATRCRNYRPCDEKNHRRRRLAALPSKVAYAGICLRWLSHQPLRLPAPWCTFSSSPGTSIRRRSRFSAAAIAQLGVGADQVPAIFAVQVANAVLFAPFINMLLAVGEEAGWRGFLYPALGERMSHRRAAILTGVVWGLWHAPLIAMGYNYGTDYLGFPVIGIVTMTIFCMAFGTFLCFLRERSRSVWPCALAHGSSQRRSRAGHVV